MTVKIQIIDIHKSFGSRTVLDGVTLDINEGEILCIVGKSGTGKSVIMKHLIGIISADSGDIIVNGTGYRTAGSDTRIKLFRKFGILFQGAALFDSMNVFDNVAFGLRRKKIPENEISRIVPSMLEQVGLRGIEDKRPSELSGGMQKRVGLARSIAMQPEIMLYDEPTTGVDPITGGAVDRLIKKMRETFGITSIVVTHDMKSAYRIADRIAMLYMGKIIFTGTPDDMRSTTDPYVRQFIEGRADGPMAIA